MDELKIGSKIWVPRSDGSQSPGEIVDIDPWDGKMARVKFVVGGTFQGQPTELKDRGRYGYKTLHLSELRACKE